VKRFGEILLAAPGSVIVISVFLIFLAVYPASQIKTDFNLEGFYPEDDQVIADYDLLESEFGRDDNVILVGFSDENLMTVDNLKIIRDLSNSFESIEFIESVNSIWNAREIKESQGTLSFELYLTEQLIESGEIENAVQSIKEDPFLKGFLINDTGTAAAILLSINEEKNTYPNRNQIIDELNEILSVYSDRFEFHISGIPYYRNQYVNLLNGEIITYIAFSSFLIIILLWYLYRSVWGVLFPMIIVWTTLLFTIALMHLTGGHLEIMSSTIAPILLCVGVADAIHMISKYDDARESGMEKRDSILEMLKTLGSATFLTSVTTAIGFASLLSSTVVPMQKFGAYTALGVLMAYVITIFFLPVLLHKSRKKRVFNEKSGSFYSLISRWLQKISALNRLHYKKTVIAGFLITAVFAAGILKINVNGKVFDDISEDTELMRHAGFFSENLSPLFPMEFIIDKGEPDGIMNADFFQRLSNLEKTLLEFDEVHRVIGLHTLISEIHLLFDDEDLERGAIPESDDLIAQYMLLLEINDADELFRLTDFDYQKVRITAFTEDAGSMRINQIRDELSLFLDENFKDEKITVTGTTILSADLTEKIVYSLAWSIIIAVVAIAIIMAFLFRNIRMVIISMVPNIIPLVVVAGIMGFLNIDIKPSTAVIFTIALGIAVDDSIHYLARFRIEYLRTGAMFPSLSITTIKTGRAIIITSMVLIAGFGTLMTSIFTSTATMGLLICTTIITAVIADLIILPSLFYWIRPKLLSKDELQQP